MSNDLKNIIEAVLLASDSPVNVARIQSLFEEEAAPEAAVIKESIEELQKDCEDRGIELRKIGSGYRFQTQEKYADYLRKLHAAKPPKLSRALLETLAIVAYRQPVSRGDIEEVRGVAVSSEIMQRLIDREWIKQVGVRDVPGRPALFGTTPEFLSYFNLESLKDLPSLMEQRELGEIAGEMETPLPPEVLAALESGEGQEESALDVTDSADQEANPDDDEDEVVTSENQDDEVDEQAEEVDSAEELEVVTEIEIENETDSEEDAEEVDIIEEIEEIEEDDIEENFEDASAEQDLENDVALEELDEEAAMPVVSKASEADQVA